MGTMTVAHGSVLAIALVACVIDVRERRIPNWLTFGAAIAGVAYQVAIGGPAGFLTGVGGWLTGAVIFLLPFALGGLGAGDVKLVAALGTWLGWSDTVWLALFTGAAGGVLALVAAAWTGYFRQALRNVSLLLTHWRVSGLRPLPELTIHDAKGPKLAYGVAILAGAMVTIWTH
jgi:prepilin peptidase CpaA